MSSTISPVCALPKSTQSFERMLEAIDLREMDVTRDINSIGSDIFNDVTTGNYPTCSEENEHDDVFESSVSDIFKTYNDLDGNNPVDLDSRKPVPMQDNTSDRGLDNYSLCTECKCNATGNSLLELTDVSTLAEIGFETDDNGGILQAQDLSPLTDQTMEPNNCISVHISSGLSADSLKRSPSPQLSLNPVNPTKQFNNGPLVINVKPIQKKSDDKQLSSRKRSLDALSHNLETPTGQLLDNESKKTCLNHADGFKFKGNISAAITESSNWESSKLNMTRKLSEPNLISSSRPIKAVTDLWVTETRDSVAHEKANSNNSKNATQHVEAKHKSFTFSDYDKVTRKLSPDIPMLDQNCCKILELKNSKEKSPATDEIELQSPWLCGHTSNENDQHSVNGKSLSKGENDKQMSLEPDASAFNGSTIKETQYIDDSIGIDHLNDNKSVDDNKSILSRNNSTFSQFTIEEVYMMNDTDTISSTNTCAVINKTADNRNNPIENDSLEYRENIEVEKTTNTKVDTSLPPQIILESNDVTKRTEMTKNDTGLWDYNNKYGRRIADRAVTDTGKKKILGLPTDLKLRLTPTPEHNEILMQDEIIRADNNPLDSVHDAKDTNSSIHSQSRNANILGSSDDSILEFSIDSRDENINITIEDQKARKTQETSSIHITEKSISIIISQNKSQNKNETKLHPTDSTTANVDSGPVGNSVLSKDIASANMHPSNVLGNFNLKTLPDHLLGETRKENIKIMDKIFVPDNPKSVVPNLTGTQNTNPLKKISQSPPEDFNSQFLTDSQLQRIDQETCTKASPISMTNLANIHPRTVTQEQEVFYRPEQNNLSAKKDPNLDIPNWVKSPVPEPDYERIKHSFHLRRQHMKQMLQEILRLSTIISKIGSILNADEKEYTPEPALRNLEIQSHSPTSVAKKSSNNCSAIQRVSVGTPTSAKSCSNMMPDNIEDGMFYRAHLSRSNYDISSNNPKNSRQVPSKSYTDIKPIITGVHNRTTSSLKDDKLCTSETSIAKYDVPSIFYGQGNVTLNSGKVPIKHVQYDSTKAPTLYTTTNVFNSLENNFYRNETAKTEVCKQNIWSSTTENWKPKQKPSLINQVTSETSQTARAQMNIGNQLQENTLDTLLFGKDETVPNKKYKNNDSLYTSNNVQPIDDSAIFYSLDKPSLLSHNASSTNMYTGLPYNTISDNTKRLSRPVKVEDNPVFPINNVNNNIFYGSNTRKQVTLQNQ